MESQHFLNKKTRKTSLSIATAFNYNYLEDVHKHLGTFPPHRIWKQGETSLTTVQNATKIVAPKGVKVVA